MVGHAGEADGAEQDGVMALDGLQPVLRHHAAGLGEPPATPILVVPGEGEVEAAAGGFEDPDRLRHHLVADAIAGDHGDAVAVGRHAVVSYLRRMPKQLSNFWSPTLG